MQLTDTSHFTTGLLFIEGISESDSFNSVNEANIDVLSHFIEIYEEEYLLNMLGEEVYREFANYLETRDSQKIKKWERLICLFGSDLCEEWDDSFYNEEMSIVLQKNDCENGEFIDYKGSYETFTIPAGTYKGATQEEANELAKETLKENAQNYVNEIGECIAYRWHNEEIYIELQKNDCENGEYVDYIGSIETFTMPERTMFSEISFADLQENIERQAQDYVNSVGTCTQVRWWNKEVSVKIQKDDCEEGHVGTFETFTIPERTVSSEISYADLQDKINIIIQDEGQKHANGTGTCVVGTYTVLQDENLNLLADENGNVIAFN